MGSNVYSGECSLYKLTLMLVGLIWPLQNYAKKCEMIETLTNGYSTESTRQELSNEHQHDRV